MSSFSFCHTLEPTETFKSTSWHFFFLLLIEIRSSFLACIGCCPVDWDCRIHRLHLCRGVRPPTNECPGYDTKQSDGEVPVIYILWFELISLTHHNISFLKSSFFFIREIHFHILILYRMINHFWNSWRWKRQITWQIAS